MYVAFSRIERASKAVDLGKNVVKARKLASKIYLAVRQKNPGERPEDVLAELIDGRLTTGSSMLLLSQMVFRHKLLTVSDV